MILYKNAAVGYFGIYSDCGILFHFEKRIEYIGENIFHIYLL